MAALALAFTAATAACAPATSSPTSDQASRSTLSLTSFAQAGGDRTGAEAARNKAKVPAAALKTFTFPDGHISFAYPAQWSIRTQPGPTVQDPTLPGEPGDCVEAILSDHRGKDVAFMVSGFYGDGASGPVDRTVFDSAPVPGLAGFEGEPTFGFFRDSFLDVNDHFYMDVRPSHELASGSTSSGSGQVALPNGAAIFRVYLDSPGFPSAEAAIAWMDTAEYARLKGLLMSVSYR